MAGAWSRPSRIREFAILSGSAWIPPCTRTRDYYRSGEGGQSGRTRYAIRGTVFARKDSGGETFATRRFGSAYGAAFRSNEWYPERLNTMTVGLEQGSTQIAFGLLGNLRAEFWPDVKNEILRRKL